MVGDQIEVGLQFGGAFHLLELFDEERADNEGQLQAHNRALVVDVQAQREKPMIAKEELHRRHKTAARELRQEIEQMEAQVC